MRPADNQEGQSLQLGRLTTVDPREVWPHEARSFTPWLLANVDVLAAVLGMDLELSGAEYAVGDFSLDLIGVDRATGERVIIENQLSVTDHSHLGQLLTYAGGTDAVNVVWIATAFREEHRAALDWLNCRTDESTRFFGVEVAAVRIGSSLPGPLFRLVVPPNNWGKTVRAKASGNGISSRDQLYERFWTLLLNELRSRNLSWTTSRKGPKQNWLSLPSGTSGIVYTCSFGRGGLCSEIYFQDPDPSVNEARYGAALARKQSIEATYGAPLQVQPLTGRKGCRIADYRDGKIGLTEFWDDYIDRFISAQQRLRTAIASASGSLSGSR